MVDYCEDEIFAVVRIGDRCEIVSYDYDITGKNGQEWFNFIGKNKPIFDKKIIENIKTVLTPSGGYPGTLLLRNKKLHKSGV